MTYIGPAPNPGQNREVDDISSGFNGDTSSFTLQVNGQNVSPGSSNNIIVSLGGVIQNPGTDYTVAASTLTFTTAPASGLSFFGLILGAGINTATVADQVITNAKISNSAGIAGSKISPDFGSQDITTTGLISGKDLILSDTTPAINLLDTTANPDYQINNTNGVFNIVDTTNSVERLVINTSGRLLVGTTTAAPNGGDAYIQAAVAGANLGAFLSNSGTTSSRIHSRFTNPNGVVGSISTSGSATSYTTSSDYRLKENETVISDGITRIKTLKPYRFNFKSDPNTKVDGFFAHEVTAVPEAITGTKDEVDSDNKPVYQGIDQSKLVPLLVAAVQELIGKVEALEAA